MASTQSDGERWVTVSALTVAGIYGYRRVTDDATDPSVKALLGQAPHVPPTGEFVTAWAVTFLIVSIMASASPEFGGMFGILIATGYFLSNAPLLAKSVTNIESGKGPAAGSSAPSGAVGHGLTGVGSAAQSAPSGVGAAVAAGANAPTGTGIGGLASAVLGG